MKKLVLQEVSFAYDKELILENISLHIEKGEIVALLGPSGIGKTTLFNLIAGIFQSTSGTVLVDGEPNPKGRVSYMLQKDLLLEHKTVLGNIILPLQIKGVKKAEAQQKAKELLQRFDLKDVQDAYPHELSGGMRQRIALLRTYLFGQDLFLLDEAFSSLDELTKMTLHTWYRSIQKELGLTTLLITHSIDEALELSDRIYILNHRPARIVKELRVDWQKSENPQLAKLESKAQILKELEIKDV